MRAATTSWEELEKRLFFQTDRGVLGRMREHSSHTDTALFTCRGGTEKEGSVLRFFFCGASVLSHVSHVTSIQQTCDMHMTHV